MERFEKNVPDSSFKEMAITLLCGMFILIFGGLGLFVGKPETLVIVGPLIIFIAFTWVMCYRRLYVKSIVVTSDKVSVTWTNRNGKLEQASRTTEELCYEFGTQGEMVIQKNMHLISIYGGRSFMTIAYEDGWKQADFLALEAAFRSVGILKKRELQIIKGGNGLVDGIPAVNIPQVFERPRPATHRLYILFAGLIAVFSVVVLILTICVNVAYAKLLLVPIMSIIGPWSASFFRMGVYRLEVEKDHVKVWWKNKLGKERQASCEVENLLYQIGTAAANVPTETIYLIAKRGYKSFTKTMFMGIIDGRDGWKKSDFPGMEAAFKAVGIEEVLRDKLPMAIIVTRWD